MGSIGSYLSIYFASQRVVLEENMYYTTENKLVRTTEEKGLKLYLTQTESVGLVR